MHASFRLKSAGLAILSAVVPVAVLSAVCYSAGLAIDPELRFLDPTRPPTAEEALILTSVEYSLRSREKNDVIVFGDSACSCGIDPARLSAGTSFNIATMGGIGPRGHVITLGAYLKHHPRPKLAVMGLSPFVLELDERSKSGDTEERMIQNYGPEVDLVPFHESIGYFVRRGAQSLVATAPDRRRDPLTYKEDDTYWTMRAKILARRGFRAPKGEYGGNDPGPAQPKLIRDDWNDALQCIADQCASQGIPLLIRFMPIKDYLAERRDWSQLERWAAELEFKHPNVRVARPIMVLYDPVLMWDGIHLNSRGVERFAPVIAADVQRVLRAGEGRGG